MDFAIAVCLTFVVSACAARGAHLTRKRRGQFVEGFALGLVLGPLGVWMAALLPRLGRSELTQKDRHCYLMIAGFGDSGARFAR